MLNKTRFEDVVESLHLTRKNLTWMPKKLYIKTSLACLSALLQLWAIYTPVNINLNIGARSRCEFHWRICKPHFVATKPLHGHSASKCQCNHYFTTKCSILLSNICSRLDRYECHVCWSIFSCIWVSQLMSKSIYRFLVEIQKGIINIFTPQQNWTAILAVYTSSYLKLHPVQLHSHDRVGVWSAGIGGRSFVLGTIVTELGLTLPSWHIKTHGQYMDTCMDMVHDKLGTRRYTRFHSGQPL